MFNVTAQKKHEYWNHFVAEAYEHNGFGNGVTGRRLYKAKQYVWDDDGFWDDVIHRHGGQNCTPYEMMVNDNGVWMHCKGNFWGMLHQIMHELGLLPRTRTHV